MQDQELRATIDVAFGQLKLPARVNLIKDLGHSDLKGAEEIRNALAGRTWQSLTPEFITRYWSHFCYLSPGAYGYYLPAILCCALEDFTDNGLLTHISVFSLRPSFHDLYYADGDQQLRQRQAAMSRQQFAAVCRFLGHAMQQVPRCRHLAAQALRWGWNDPASPELESALEYYRHLHTPAADGKVSPQVGELAAFIREAFRKTPYPGDMELSGSEMGDEPAEYAMELRGLRWQQLHPKFLEMTGTALSFLSPPAYRYFLPAFLVAYLLHHESYEALDDCVFHLTRGIRSDNSNDEDTAEYYRARFTCFTFPERVAIARYLRYLRHFSWKPEEIDFALGNYWESPSA